MRKSIAVLDQPNQHDMLQVELKSAVVILVLYELERHNRLPKFTELNQKIHHDNVNKLKLDRHCQ